MAKSNAQTQYSNEFYKILKWDWNIIYNVITIKQN